MDTVNNILDDVVNDVSEPSPISDMPVTPAETPASEGAGVSTIPQKEEKKDGRGRKKLPRDSNGKIIRENNEQKSKTEKPPLFGGQTVNHDTAGIDASAEVAVGLVNMSGVAMGGADATMTKEEQYLAKGSFVAYFKAKGIKDVPPWIIVLGGVAPYYMRILRDTPAKNTMSSMVGRITFGIKDFFIRRKNARSNRRHNHERQNDTGKTSSQES
jgi:hypothetical protein